MVVEYAEKKKTEKIEKGLTVAPFPRMILKVIQGHLNRNR